MESSKKTATVSFFALRKEVVRLRKGNSYLRGRIFEQLSYAKRLEDEVDHLRRKLRLRKEDLLKCMVDIIPTDPNEELVKKLYKELDMRDAALKVKNDLLADAKAWALDRTKTVGELTEKLTHMRKINDDKNNEISEKMDRVRDLNVKVDQLSADLANKNGVIADYDRKLANFGDRDAMVKTIDQLKKETLELSAELERRNRTSREEEEQNRTAQTGTAAKLRVELSSLKRTMCKRNETITKLKLDISKFQKKFMTTAKNTTISKPDNEDRQLKQKFTDLQRTLQKRNSTITGKNGEINKMKLELTKLQEVLLNKNETIAEKDKHLRLLNAGENMGLNLSDKLIDLKVHCQRQANYIEAQKEEMKALKTKLADASSQSMTNDVIDIQTKLLNDRRKEVDHLRSLHSRAENEVGILREQVVHTNKMCEVLKKELDTLRKSSHVEDLTKRQRMKDFENTGRDEIKVNEDDQQLLLKQKDDRIGSLNAEIKAILADNDYLKNKLNEFRTTASNNELPRKEAELKRLRDLETENMTKSKKINDLLREADKEKKFHLKEMNEKNITIDKLNKKFCSKAELLRRAQKDCESMRNGVACCYAMISRLTQNSLLEGTAISTVPATTETNVDISKDINVNSKSGAVMLDDLTQEIGKIEASYRKFQTANGEKDEEIQKLQNELKVSTAKLKMLLANSKELSDECRDLKLKIANYSSMTEKAAELEQKLKRNEEELVKLRNRCAALSEINSSLSNEKPSSSTDVEDDKTQTNVSKSRGKYLRREHRRRDFSQRGGIHYRNSDYAGPHQGAQFVNDEHTGSYLHYNDTYQPYPAGGHGTHHVNNRFTPYPPPSGFRGPYYW